MNSESIKDIDLKFMDRALRCARIGEKFFDEVPVGALTVLDGKIISAGLNKPISSKDPTAHAEIVAIRRATKKLGAYRIPDVDLYVTLEPCTMCMGAIIQARIKTVYFGAPDPKVGVVSTGVYRLIEQGLNHRLTIVGGLRAEQAASMLREFFSGRR